MFLTVHDSLLSVTYSQFCLVSRLVAVTKYYWRDLLANIWYIPNTDESVPIKPTCQLFNLDDQRKPGGNVLIAWIRSRDNRTHVIASNFCLPIILIRFSLHTKLKYKKQCLNKIIHIINSVIQFKFYTATLLSKKSSCLLSLIFVT